MPKPSSLPAVSISTPSEPSREEATSSVIPSSKVASVGSTGPRKLIRPTLSARAPEPRRNLRNEAPLLTAQEVRASAELVSSHESSHAEMFYLKKQAQSQTLMTFVLEDGEQIDGYIEWYDRNAIKVRNGTRILIYKSSIKYIYKAEGSRA